jgi:hypothetical protein
MENIEFEATDLVKRLMNDTAKNGHVNPTGYLQLTTLNIIFDITIGKRYESLDDPELHEIITMLKRNIYFGGIEKDISTYLPILSVFDRFSGLESTMKDHFVNTRDVIIRKLISQAVQKNEINIMKTLNDEASNLDEMDKVILLCKFFFFFFCE